MRWRRGRHRFPRFIEHIPRVSFFKPMGIPMRELEIVELSFAEVEAMRLVDLENLTQEEAARRMGISRRSLWSDLANARKKVTHALTKGCAIQFVGSAPRSAPKEENEE